MHIPPQSLSTSQQWKGYPLQTLQLPWNFRDCCRAGLRSLQRRRMKRTLGHGSCCFFVGEVTVHCPEHAANVLERTCSSCAHRQVHALHKGGPQPPDRVEALRRNQHFSSALRVLGRCTADRTVSKGFRVGLLFLEGQVETWRMQRHMKF